MAVAAAGVETTAVPAAIEKMVVVEAADAPAVFQ